MPISTVCGFLALAFASFSLVPLHSLAQPGSPRPVVRPAGQPWQYKTMALCMDESNKNNYRGFIESSLAQMGQNSYELVTINQWLGPVPAGSTNCFLAVFKRQAP